MIPIPIISTEMVVYILIGVVIVLTLLLIRLEHRFNKVLRGKKGDSLEETIHELLKGVSDLQTFQRESIEYLKNIEARLKRSIQSVETTRFNPFKGTGEGGNQSFATAFLNEKGDGAIVSSLYSRDRVSIFSKPVKKFSSEFELTKEEKETLQKAKNSLAYETKNK